MAAITEVDESELESDDTNDGGDLDRAALMAWGTNSASACATGFIENTKAPGSVVVEQSFSRKTRNSNYQGTLVRRVYAKNHKPGSAKVLPQWCLEIMENDDIDNEQFPPPSNENDANEIEQSPPPAGALTMIKRDGAIALKKFPRRSNRRKMRQPSGKKPVRSDSDEDFNVERGGLTDIELEARGFGNNDVEDIPLGEFFGAKKKSADKRSFAAAANGEGPSTSSSSSARNSERHPSFSVSSSSSSSSVPVASPLSHRNKREEKKGKCLPFASPLLARSEGAPKSDEEAEFDFSDNGQAAMTVTRGDLHKRPQAATAARLLSGAGRHDLGASIGWRESNTMSSGSLAQYFPSQAIAVQEQKKREAEQGRKLAAGELTRRSLCFPTAGRGTVDMTCDLHSGGGERVSTIGGNGAPLRFEHGFRMETATELSQRHKRKREARKKAGQRDRWG